MYSNSLYNHHKDVRFQLKSPFAFSSSEFHFHAQWCIWRLMFDPHYSGYIKSFTNIFAITTEAISCLVFIYFIFFFFVFVQSKQIICSPHQRELHANNLLLFAEIHSFTLYISFSWLIRVFILRQFSLFSSPISCEMSVNNGYLWKQYGSIIAKL